MADYMLKSADAHWEVIFKNHIISFIFNSIGRAKALPEVIG